jgi:hypothetical protein
VATRSPAQALTRPPTSSVTSARLLGRDHASGAPTHGSHPSSLAHAHADHHPHDPGAIGVGHDWPAENVLYNGSSECTLINCV